jgi:hypothetical protein
VPRKLVVWCSADAAIPSYWLLARTVSEMNWWLVFEWKCPVGEVDLYTALETRGAKLVDVWRDTSARPNWLPQRLWIWRGIMRRPCIQSLVATWRQRSPRPHPTLSELQTILLNYLTSIVFHP